MQSDLPQEPAGHTGPQGADPASLTESSGGDEVAAEMVKAARYLALLAGIETPIAGRAPTAEQRPDGAATEPDIVSFCFAISPKDRKRLKSFSAESGIKFQQMGLEALSMWLVLRGQPPLINVKANFPDGRRHRKRGTVG